MGLCLLLTGCMSMDRLFRNSPMSGVETSADRINLWPLYYQGGDGIAVLWPVFDEDEKGFALRPLITRDESQWEILPPLCWFDIKTGSWWFLPAYSIDENHGLFPVFGLGVCPTGQL